MMFNVFYDAIMRYGFNQGSIALQETEWHLFSLMFLLGISYTLKEDGHVRVDILYDRFGARTQAVINMVGTLMFLIPLALLILHGAIPFVKEAYISGEISGDPGGLTHRWLIKAAIPVAFGFLVFSALGFFIRQWRLFLGAESSGRTS